MSYFGNTRIISKKVVGNKLLYLVVTSNSKRWIDYEQLTDYLPYVIEYEKSMNPSIMTRGSSKQKIINNFQQQSHNLVSKFKKNEQIPIKNIEQYGNLKIKQIQFIDFLGYDQQNKQKILLFKVLSSNGTTDYLTNKQIKQIDMNLLVKYYQNQIK